MESHLRAGIAIFNAGRYHAAHDAWEEHWLGLESGSDDERFLHGLIQYTAAVHHARTGNWGGATGLADSAGEYLADLPAEYRGIDVASVRQYLDRLAADPELIERRRPLPLTDHGDPIGPADLDFEATAVAAETLAEDRGEGDLLDRAVEYAREDIGGTAEPLRGETDSRILPLVFDYVRDPDHRGIIAQRLEQHCDRRQARADDVAGLFDPEE
jgi:predicted metal-dependent hydrolase